MIRSRPVETFIFLLIVCVAAGLRLPGLDRVPPELNQDEASRGVDAWQIFQTGADRHGRRWPLFLESFGPGDWTAALTTYFTVPFVAWMGPTTAAIRMPDALLGTATVIVVYFWLRRGRGWATAACAAAVLATNPWHIALCRTAHESGFAPFFLAVALLGLDRAGIVPAGEHELTSTQRVRRAWAVGAGLMLSMHTWCYPATRLFTPLLCLAIICVYRRRILTLFAIRDGRRLFACAAAGLVAGAAPIWWTALSYPERLAARAAVTMRIYAGGSAAAIMADCAQNWLRNVDPRYLFIEADEMSGATMPGVGQHLPALAPLMVAGLVACLIRAGRSPWAAFVVAWWIIHPIPAALCHDWNPHPMRTVGGMLVYPVLAAIGFELLAAAADAQQRLRRRALLAMVALATVMNVSYFFNVYFLAFPKKAEPLYQAALIRAMRAADARMAADSDDRERFVITNSALQPYIYAMWLEAVRTRRALPVDFESTPGPRGFHQVTGWGRFAFVPAHADGFEASVAQFQRRLAEWEGASRTVRALVRESEAGERPVLAKFPQGDGDDPFQNFVICDVSPAVGNPPMPDPAQPKQSPDTQF